MIVFINGYSGSGKTFFSEKLGKELDLEVIHCDSFIAPGNWATIPDIIIEKIKDKDNYILEGVAVGRIVRRLSKSDLNIRPDRYYYLTELHKEIDKKVESFNKGINTIQLEVNKILESWGIDVKWELPEKKEQRGA
jgi:cytidylate kinase